MVSILSSGTAFRNAAHAPIPAVAHAPAAEPPPLSPPPPPPPPSPPVPEAAGQFPAVHWNDLNYDIKICVASYLPARSLSRFAQTNQAHAALASDRHVISKMAPPERSHWLWNLVQSGAIDSLGDILRLSLQKDRNPGIAAWVDAPDAQRRTPVSFAYDNHDHELLACLVESTPKSNGGGRRLQLACRAIADRDHVALGHLLRSLPQAVRQAQREMIIRSVAAVGERDSVREVANIYGEQMFAPMFMDETVLHMKAWETGEDLDWLLAQPGSTEALHQTNIHGRTPLLMAAARGDTIGLQLATYYPESEITDRDHEGNGLLQSAYRDVRAEALALLASPPWLERITVADKTATLVAAFNNCASHNFHHDSLEVHLGLIRILSSLPAGQISRDAHIGQLDMSIAQASDTTRLTRWMKSFG